MVNCPRGTPSQVKANIAKLTAQEPVNEVYSFASGIKMFLNCLLNFFCGAVILIFVNVLQPKRKNLRKMRNSNQIVLEQIKGVLRQQKMKLYICL